MPGILKRADSALGRHRNTVWILLGVLLLTLAFVLHKFRPLRIPIVAVVIGLFLFLLLWLLPKWQARCIPNPDLAPEERFDRENEARKTLSQILGGLALLTGIYFTWQNLDLTRNNERNTERISRASLNVDRYTKAIAQLEDGKLVVRLAGIYELEVIANDVDSDTKDNDTKKNIKDDTSNFHPAVMAVLTAFVRHPPELNTPDTSSAETECKGPHLRTDIQAILTVIGRRHQTYKDGEEWPLNLNDTDLRGAHLVGANLRGMLLTGSRFDGAELKGADLTDAFLTSADLRGACFTPDEVYPKATDLTGADLTRADLSGVDLGNVMGLTLAQLESAKGNAATKLPPYIQGRPKSWQ